ncbi:hypothetical protein [Massilia timonae]|nr:hypothetical protein [Massilia timonae]
MKKLILILLFGASAACTTQAHDPVQPPAKDGAPRSSRSSLAPPCPRSSA